MQVPGRVGSVNNSASRGVQNEIVTSAGNLGRVGGMFGRISEKIWTRRRKVLDASAGICGRVGGEFSGVGERTYPCRSGIIADATNNYELVESALCLE